MTITIKIRPLQGPVFTLDDLSETTTLRALFDRIFETGSNGSNLPRANLNLLTGYPPRPLQDDPQNTLKDAGIRSGQLLLMRTVTTPTTTTATPKSPKRRRRVRVSSSSSSSKSNGNLMGSKEDIAERLVGATWRVEDPIDKFLRHAQRLAVKKQYEIAEGNRRYAAALGNDFEIRQTGASVNASVRVCRVQYKFGQRTYHEDEFQLLNDEILRETLREILGLNVEKVQEKKGKEKEEEEEEEEKVRRRERLRPFFIAEISPQLFWSIVKNHGTDFKRAFSTLLPEVSWDFLDTRYRRISSKAKEARENEAYAKALRAAKRHKRKEPEKPKTIEDLTLPSELTTGFKEKNVLKVCLLSDAEQATLLSKHDKAAIQSWLEGARSYAAKTLVEIVMPFEKCREAAASVLEVQTVYDVVRLKVPGRIKLLAEESGEAESLFVSAQKEAETLVEKYPFLADYRTRG